jgi:ubiquinone/menaquinone biosynthesis C-methylase UbiE
MLETTMAEVQSDPRFFVFDWDEVFDVEDYLYFYEDTLHAERTPHQVDMLCTHLAILPGMQVLDIGCGHGRHALELARRGLRVVGIDRMAGFLEMAKRDAAKEDLEVRFELGDARELEETASFDRILCLFDAFGLHADDENEDILRRIARALKPGGRVCIDVRNRDWIVRALLPVTVMQKGQDLMVDRHVFDPISGRLVDYRLMVRDGKTKEARFSVRLYHFAELRALLAHVGLFVTEAFGTWDGEPIGLQHNRMVLMCEKKDE